MTAACDAFVAMLAKADVPHGGFIFPDDVTAILDKVPKQPGGGVAQRAAVVDGMLIVFGDALVSFAAPDPKHVLAVLNACNVYR